MIFAWVIPGVIFVAALSIMLRNEAKCTRRSENAIDSMFTGKKR